MASAPQSNSIFFDELDMKPPSHLDNANVLYWPWSGDQPFGFIHYINGAIAAEIYGFVICLSDGQLYRLL